MDLPIKYYLNKRLKPKIIDFKEHYPVYFRFNSGGTNHQIKSQLVGYLNDENGLNDCKSEIKRESSYINTLFDFYEGRYSFINFEYHSKLLNTNLYQLFNSYYLSICDAEFTESYEIELRYEFSSVYKEELQNFLSLTTGLPSIFFCKVIDDKLINLNVKLPTNFVKNERLLIDIEIHNILLQICNEDSITLYDWFFNNARMKILEFLSNSQIELLDKFLKNIYDEIFQKYDKNKK